ncbi:MAG: gliding motility-associated C-terminal domain-containing protein [Saprospiraceae bacterium]|nr:gliding motility-associated C-terminal domain-containing protein [Saprospiraceae bacterium]
MRTITLLFSLLACGALPAQQRFVQEFRTDRDDAGLAVQQVENKEFLMLNYRFGLPAPLGPGGLNLTKMSDLGRLRWSRDYDFDFPVVGGDLAYWPQQGSYLVGTVSAVDTARDKIVAKFNTLGGLEWARRLGSACPLQFENGGRAKVLPVSDSTLVVAAGAGQFTSAAGDNDILLAKLDEDGQLLWSRQFCFSCLGNYETVLGDLLATSDGGFLLSGSLYFTGLQGIQQEALLIKTDSTGQVLWAQSLAAAAPNVLLPRLTAWSLAEPKKGLYAVSGTHSDLLTMRDDGLFLTVDQAGVVTFSTRWNLANGKFDIFNFDLASRDTNTVVLAGSTVEDTFPNVAREYNFLAAITIDSFKTVWAKNYFEEIAVGITTPYHALTPTIDGGYAYHISIDTVFVNSNPVLVKTNDEGVTGCEADLLLTADSLALAGTVWIIPVNNLSDIDTIELKDEMAYNDIMPTMEGLELTGGGGQLCAPVMELLDATVQEAEKYLWNTGATTPTIVADKEGLFTVEVSSEALCFYLPDTTSINVLPPPMGSASADPDSLCEERKALLFANGSPVFTYAWSTGEVTPVITVLNTGTYTVTMTNPCGSITATVQVPRLGCICDLRFPNAFTPDGDSENDRFKPVEACTNLTGFQLFVYNRWGENVYAGTSQAEGWNGEHNGLQAPSDVYVWYATFTTPEGEKKTMQGDVTLLR